MVNFTQSQLATATTVWNILKQYGYNDISNAGVIGNLYAESALNPNVNEHSGGGGYGLGQWTPKSNLYAQAKVLGISNAEAETAAGQAKIIAQGERTGQWLNYGNPAYHSTVVTQQTLAQFKQSNSVTAAAANFCAHWERPSVQYAHMNVRIDAAESIYQKLKGSSGGGTTKKGGELMLFFKVGNGVYFLVGNKYTLIASPTELLKLKTMMEKAGYDTHQHTDPVQISYLKKIAQAV